MTKKHKGFMLVELLIVSVFILSVLIFLYIQLINVNDNYKRSFTYNTVPGLYIAKNVVNYISEAGYSKAIDDLNNTGKSYVNLSSIDVDGSLYNDIIKKSNIKQVILTYNNPSTIQSYLNLNKNDSNFNRKFRDFINKIPKSEDSGYRIIIEYNDNTYATVIDPNTI